MATARKTPTTKRGPGRPRKPRPTGPQQPQPIVTPDPIVAPADDTAAQTVADKLADAVASATAPGSSGAGGRPTARAAAMNQLADNLATAYTAAGGALCVAAVPLALFAPDIAERLDAIGTELQRSAVECGNALARWADTNDKVKQFLTGASGHAGMLMVLAVHLPIVGAAVGRRDAGRLAADVIGGVAGDGPGPAGGVGDFLGGGAGGFAATFQDLFATLIPQPGERGPVVDTTATEVPTEPAADDVAA